MGYVGVGGCTFGGMKRQVVNFRFSNSVSDDGGVADFHIDGALVDADTQQWLAYWGDELSTSFRSFRDQLEGCKASRINIRMNSGGGACIEGWAMHDYVFQNWEAKNIHMYGIGIVASAATYPLMAVPKDRCHISDNCFVMVHNVSGGCYGDVDDVESVARSMRKFNDQARDKYVDWFGESADTITQWMKSETWMRGSELRNQGYIPSTEPGGGLTNRIDPEQWHFKNTAILNVINSGIPLPQNTTGMKTKKILNALQAAFASLGVKNDSSVVTLKVGEFQQAFKACLEATAGDDGDEDELVDLVKNALSGDSFRNAVAAEVAKALATVPPHFSSAITDATKGFVTQDAAAALVTRALSTVPENFTAAINDALKAGTKDLATTEALTKLSDDVINRLSGRMKPDNGGKREPGGNGGAKNDGDGPVLSVVSRDGGRFVQFE